MIFLYISMVYLFSIYPQNGPDGAQDTCFSISTFFKSWGWPQSKSWMTMTYYWKPWLLGDVPFQEPPPVIPIYTRYDRFMIFLLQDVEKSSATSIFSGAHNPIHVGRFRNHRWVRDVSSSSCKQTCSWTGVFPAWLVQCSWYKLDVGDYIPWSPMTHLTHGSDNPQLIQEQK